MCSNTHCIHMWSAVPHTGGHMSLHINLSVFIKEQVTASKRSVTTFNDSFAQGLCSDTPTGGADSLTNQSLTLCLLLGC